MSGQRRQACWPLQVSSLNDYNIRVDVIGVGGCKLDVSGRKGKDGASDVKGRLCDGGKVREEEAMSIVEEARGN